ncbi:MAG: PAS domain S-box protein [Opitutae bacterium]|nr:PAS domain S-box protein [Opitutae bacterium]
MKNLIGTVAAMTEPALLAGDRWRQGGVDILFANEAFAALTGHSAEELKTKNTRDLHGPKTDLTLLRRGRRGTDSEPTAHGEGWLHRGDGRPFYASWSFSPVTDATGATVGLLAVYRDNTEMKQLQEALLHSQKLDTVGQLTGGVAHDFNNLLSIINGYCEILAPKVAALPAARKDLQEIHRAGVKASAIARQILEFSRRSETEVRVVNYNTLIREIADILRRVVGEAVAVELRLASDLGNVRIDPTQFQQVLINLCFNARDAMPDGGKLTIRTYNRRGDHSAGRPAAAAEAGPLAVLQVTDTGHGMDEATRRRMFEPFFTTKPAGTGLGLAMVHNIVTQNDGHLAVQSQPGAGTTLEIFLPETPEPEQTLSSVLPALPVTRGTETVLLVEADLVLRKMIGGILAADGYRVTEAGDAAEAGALFEQHAVAPQLLVLDCEARAGDALVKKIRATNPRLKVLCVSAGGGTPAGLAPHTVAHLTKPFALSGLMHTVRALLDDTVR